MDPVALLQDLHDAPRPAGIVIHLSHRLVEVGIKGGAEGLDAADAKSPQRRQELALGRANAFEERGVGRRLIDPILRRSDRPLQIIRNRQKLGRKVENSIFARIRHASFGAASRVLDLGQSSKQALAQGRVRGLERRGLPAVNRRAFACQTDFVYLIIIRNGYLPCSRLVQSAGRANA
jgi:hypothetical protein